MKTKKLCTAAIVSILLQDSAWSVDQTVLVRDHDNQLVRKSINFESPILENDYFKIVISTSDDAVNLEDGQIDPEKKLLASNAFYHLNIAREKLIETTDSEYIKNLPKRVIRIGMNHGFNAYKKYSETNDVAYNNSVTIPASSLKKLDEISSWDSEIWFRDPNAREIDNVVTQVTEQMTFSKNNEVLLSNLGADAVETSISDLAMNESFELSYSRSHIEQMAILYVATAILPNFINFFSKEIKSETYLNSAAIPEIIYHEYAHLALSDKISVRNDSVVSEGFANYFAAAINGDYHLADDMGKYAKNSGGYDGEFKFAYRTELEKKGSEHNGFIYSYLVALREEIASTYPVKEYGYKVADLIIYESRNNIQHKVSPVRDLTTAIVRSISKIDKSKRRILQMKILKTANKFGI